MMGRLPSLIDGKYRVDAVIGRGGMGAIYQAHDVRLDRDVAIKIVRGDFVGAPDAQARFRREAQIVARLQHPAIVTLFDYGTLPNGAGFLVMELVRGEDLRALLKRETRIPALEVATIVDAVAAGLEAAHAVGVLHRDVKPENILLPAGGSGAKVLDFGVATMTDPEAGAAIETLIGSGTILGTPAYMAPEQLRGEMLDGRADVYSLGVVTYEAITGALPFGSSSSLDLGPRQATRRQEDEQNSLPENVRQAVERAITFDRALRPRTPLAFAEALRAGLES